MKNKQENHGPAPRWHPVKRKEKSLNSLYAEAMGEDLHFLEEDHEVKGVELALDTSKYGYKVSKEELEQMRRVAFS